MKTKITNYTELKLKLSDQEFYLLKEILANVGHIDKEHDKLVTKLQCELEKFDNRA